MAHLSILTFPDPRLRIKAKPVDCFDEVLAQLAEDMLETMYSAPGIGLAATQVNVHQQLLVADVSEDQDQPYVLINPEVESEQGQQSSDEGCLSVPGFYEAVERPEQVTIRAQDLQGQWFSLEAEGLLARCILHEMDHLQGKLFVDYLSLLKRNRIRKKIEKQRRVSA